MSRRIGRIVYADKRIWGNNQLAGTSYYFTQCCNIKWYIALLILNSLNRLIAATEVCDSPTLVSCDQRVDKKI